MAKKKSVYGVQIIYEKKYKGTSIGRNPKSKKTMNKHKKRTWKKYRGQGRIDDHEKLCRIMQEETNKTIEANGKKIDRLEKVVMSSTAMLIVGMGTIIYNLLIN